MKADQIVQKTIKEHGLIQAKDCLLLGFSGGPDSLCLLHILAKLQQPLQFELHALHVNHQIRGAEAIRDMRASMDICQQMHIPLTVKTANVPELAKLSGKSEEAVGREVRHKALQQLSQQLQKEYPNRKVKIVLAHNKDDQAETVLMRILRGTGIRGLGAMEYAREDGLIRPLLDTPRTAIEDYLREKNLAPCIDSSNSSSEYTRNKVRLQLLPLLEKEYNPSIKDGLVRMAAAAREAEQVLTRKAKENVPANLVIPRERLNRLDEAVAKKVICMLFERCGLTQNIGAVHLNSLLSLCRRNGSGTIEFPQGYKAVVQSGMVYFRSPHEAVEKSQPPTPPAPVKKKARLVQTSMSLKKLQSGAVVLPKKCCVLDAVKVLALGKDLQLRTRKSGDRIHVLGMEGTKKLQDYMVDEKIPREKRDSIRLLCCGHAVLWVEGYTISQICRIDETTKYVLITEIREE